MRNFLILVGFLAALSGCQSPAPTPKSTAETNPATKTESPEEIPARTVSLKVTLLTKGMVFFLTEQEEQELGFTSDRIEEEFEKLPEDERAADLLVLRGDGKTLSDIALAAATLLPIEGENQTILKNLLLAVPPDLANDNRNFDQAYESWGDLAADFIRKTKDKDVLTALYTHDLEGAAAEGVIANRVDLLTENPEFVLPALNDVQLTDLGTKISVGSQDVEATVNELIKLEKSPDKKLANAATKVLASFESQQRSDEIESRVP